MKGWKPFNMDNIKKDGFIAGFSRGQNTYIGKDGVEPGQLCIGTPYRGFYYSNMHKSHFKHINSGMDYLAEDDKCTYKWVRSSHGVIVDNGVWVDHGNIVYIARTDIGNDHRIGKVGTWIPNNKMHYAYGDDEQYTQNYEVLTCVPKEQTTTTTTTVAPVIVPTTTTSKPETTTNSQTAIYD